MEKAKPFEIPKRFVWKAYRLVRANDGAAGVDGQTLVKFDENLSKNLYKLWNRLSSGSYQPQSVRRVEIPKKSGGTRPLGIPTVADRIAQMTARLCFEPMVEPKFHADSYGYRPGKSAHQAVAAARERCWKYDWVIDLDIKGFFDTIDHELMMKAVDFHKPATWVRLYIERWLKAPAEDDAGTIYERKKGTPQGGVISPLLANLFLHYAFDKWMVRCHRDNPFERYADDIVIHCRTQVEAENLLEEVKLRLTECKLTVHPEKTKIVYCKDRNRKGTYEMTGFDFLGFTFRPRTARGKNGKLFPAFTPAISRKSERAIKDTIRAWRIHRAVTATLERLSMLYNAKLAGWFAYYGKFRPSALYGIFCLFQKILVKWAKCKYKRLKGSRLKSAELMKNAAESMKHLFIHWERGWYANGGV
jgi:group II intron reverse transcriptase/maturase